MNTDDAIKTAVKQIVDAKVAEAFAGDSGVIGKIVNDVMEYRERGGYSSDRRTLLERAVHDAAETVIRESVREFMAEQQDFIKATIKSRLSLHVDDVATSILNGVVSDDWRVRMHINLGKED